MNTVEKMNLRKWYGTSVRIPDYNSYNFTSFVVSSFGIVKSILREKLKQDIKIRFTDNGTAYADMENHVIGMNRAFVDGVFPGSKNPLPSDKTIAVILGIVVHEAAHFAYSPYKTLKLYTDHVKKHTTCKFYEGIAASLGNIIEDIYIEAELGRSVPTLSWMLEELNGVFFPDDELSNLLDKTVHIVSAPETREDVVLGMDILIHAKTRSLLTTTPYLTELFALVRSATELDRFEERTALCLDVYNSLLEKLDDSEDEGESENGENGEDGDGEGDGSMTAEQFKEALKEMLQKSENITAKHDGKESDKKVVQPGGVKAVTISREMERMNDAVIHVESEGEGTNDAQLTFVEFTPREGGLMEMDERYVRLAEVGRQRATVNRPYGMDMNRGNNIRKLHRIATDGKIFAQPMVMNNYKPMQVVILIDCSGSMFSPLRVKGGITTRVEAAMRASIGAAHGLTEARCEVAVYGHTADMDGSYSVRIYRGKDFSEPVSVLSKRWDGLKSSREFCQNRDGDAIRYVSRKFTASQRRKLLIVISDGLPASLNYNGRHAEKHCKEQVRQIRERNIEVLSISIAEEARRANDEIYGSQWNVFNEDPNVLEKIVQSLLG